MGGAAETQMAAATKAVAATGETAAAGATGETALTLEAAKSGAGNPPALLYIGSISASPSMSIVRVWACRYSYPRNGHAVGDAETPIVVAGMQRPL